MFDPVHLEDAGEYVCTGEIELANISTVVVETKQILSLKCKYCTCIHITVTHNKCWTFFCA